MKILLVNEKQNSCQSAPGVYRARQRIIYQSNRIKGKIKGSHSTQTEKKGNDRSPVQREKKHVASVMEESTQECWKEHSRADMHNSQGVREQILPKPEILLQKKKKEENHIVCPKSFSFAERHLLVKNTQNIFLTHI